VLSKYNAPIKNDPESKKKIISVEAGRTIVASLTSSLQFSTNHREYWRARKMGRKLITEKNHAE